MSLFFSLVRVLLYAKRDLFASLLAASTLYLRESENTSERSQEGEKRWSGSWEKKESVVHFSIT